jgi:peptidoglycan/LPS O-acetylase OafA/YrhL
MSTPSQPLRVRYVQGLRAVAILLVVAYHAGLPLAGGYLGVDVFFVISGFVITGVLLRDLKGPALPGLVAFYQRRVRRLLPALAVLLVAVAVMSALFESPFTRQPTTGHVGIFASFFLANDALYHITGGYFADSSAGQLLLHTWSLAVEEQFYFLFPVLLLLGLRIPLRRRPWVAPAIVIAAVTAVSLTVFLVLTVARTPLPFAGNPGEAAFYLPFGRAWEFGAGALVALRSARGGTHSRTVALILAPIAAVVLLVSAFRLGQSSVTSPSPALVVPVAATAILISVLGAAESPLGRLLSSSPLVWIGDCSYSWYLWHWPLIVLARTEWPYRRLALVIAATVALGIARLSYVHIEQRFRRPRRTFGRAHPLRAALAVALVCIAVPATMMAALRSLALDDWNRASIAQMRAQVTPVPPGSAERCASASAVAHDGFAACTVGAHRPGDPIYLIGDSNAGQYADGVLAAGAALHRPVILAWKSRCSFIDVVIALPNYNEAACRSYNAELTTWFRAHRSGTIVTSSLDAYIDPTNARITDPTTGTTSTNPAVKQRMWADGLTRSLHAVREAGHPVVLIGVLPHPLGEGSTFGPRWDPRNCSLLSLSGWIGGCGVTVSLAAEDKRQARPIAAEADAVKRTGVSFLDLRDVVCLDGECATNHGNDWVYRDGHHITNRESAALEPQLRRAISAAAIAQT